MGGVVAQAAALVLLMARRLEQRLVREEAEDVVARARQRARRPARRLVREAVAAVAARRRTRWRRASR